MSKTTDKEADFEETLADLEKLVAKLEDGDLSLDESLAEFKRGIDLTRQCQTVLDQAQQTVDELTKPDDPDSLKAFEPDA
jgi:exodeoxyribonuclease VII small subunit